MIAPQANPPVRIAVENPNMPEVLSLLRDAADFSNALYPVESNHHLPVDILAKDNVFFHVGRDTAGVALATGALVVNGGWAEIKAMWVSPQWRGRGLSKATLSALEGAALQRCVQVLRLETGVLSHAAIGLYTGAGFRRCGPFADYRPDPLSVFMEKSVQRPAVECQ